MNQPIEITETDQEFMARVVAACESALGEAHREFENRIKLIGNEITEENRRAEAAMEAAVRSSLAAAGIRAIGISAVVSAVVAFVVTWCAG